MLDAASPASAPLAPTSAPAPAAPQRPTWRLVLELLRPYRAGLIIVLVAMLVETAMSLVAAWRLEVILDNAHDHHPLPHRPGRVHDFGLPLGPVGPAAFARLA